MVTRVEPIAGVIYSAIKEPLKIFAEKTKPSAQWDWYHDEPRWLLRWKESKILQQVEIRLRESKGKYYVIVGARDFKPGGKWSPEAKIYEEVVYEMGPEGQPHYYKDKVTKASDNLFAAYEKAKSLSR